MTQTLFKRLESSIDFYKGEDMATQGSTQAGLGTHVEGFPGTKPNQNAQSSNRIHEMENSHMAS